MLGRKEIMKLEDKLLGSLGIGFVLFWILSALAYLAGTGMVVYILWRIATHPW
jgi:hypothetical protein